MVAVFIVLWIVAIVGAAVVLVACVQLWVSTARSPASIVLSVLFLLTAIVLLALLVMFTQQMAAKL